MKLMLIRHGQSVANAEGIIQGHADYPLSNQGVTEARMLGEWMARESLDAIYSSDLMRAYQTAAEIATYHELAITRKESFREHCLGLLEGLKRAEALERFPECHDRDWLVTGIDGVESVDQFCTRCTTAVRDLLQQHKDQTVVLVCHGGFINFLLMALLGVARQGKRYFRHDNTGITTIRFDGFDDFKILGVNETPHLSRQAGPAPGATGRSAHTTP